MKVNTPWRAIVFSKDLNVFFLRRAIVFLRARTKINNVIQVSDVDDTSTDTLAFTRYDHTLYVVPYKDLCSYVVDGVLLVCHTERKASVS